MRESDSYSWMYKIRNAGAKGLGVFATKHISRGTRILAERPLFTVKTEQDAFAAIRRLSVPNRQWLSGLSTSNSPQPPGIFSSLSASWYLCRNGIPPSPTAIAEHHISLALFRNNNFDLGDGTQAMFREISRLNHSCVPNSQGNFNASNGEFAIHATRAVDAGDEITIGYLVEHGAVREVRQRRLRQSYGFDCKCPICDAGTAIGQRSEKRRVEMRERVAKHAEMNALSGKSNLTNELQMLVDMIEMFEDEGLAGRELATMYFAAAENAMSLSPSSREAAGRYAQRGLQIDQTCVGTDNPVYVESVERMRHIKS